MKINEKNLSAYATSDVPSDKEGYLLKAGDGSKGFQRRWFVLKGNLLFYFEKKGDKEPIGVIVLEGCTVELGEMDAQFCFKLVFHSGGSRNYVMCAESQEGMEQWMKVLACSSYGYMKLMVTELKRQLNQLGESSTTCCNHAHMTNGGIVSGKTGGVQKSPLPPPRNKHAQTLGKSVKAPSANGSSSRIKISFRELHTSYGRPIMTDRAEWRAKQYDEQPLISL